MPRARTAAGSEAAAGGAVPPERAKAAAAAAAARDASGAGAGADAAPAADPLDANPNAKRLRAGVGRVVEGAQRAVTLEALERGLGPRAAAAVDVKRVHGRLVRGLGEGIAERAEAALREMGVDAKLKRAEAALRAWPPSTDPAALPRPAPGASGPPRQQVRALLLDEKRARRAALEAELERLSASVEAKRAELARLRAALPALDAALARAADDADRVHRAVTE